MRKIHLRNEANISFMGEEVCPVEMKAPWCTDTLISPAEEQVNAGANRFILIIDDSATVRKIMEICLSRAGFAVKSFADGVEAMQWLSQSDARVPQLIFLDICLPRMDGYEVARRLKAKTPLEQTVIIILSRRDGVLDRLKGRLAGAKDYLTKPFQTQTILATVEAHLGLPV